jgi:sigma-54-dependent transcriptional regulator
MNDIGRLVKSLSFIEEFVETTTTLATERDVPTLLNLVLTSARNFTNCEAGRVYVLDVTKRYLHLRVSQWQDRALDTQWYRLRDFGQTGVLDTQDPLVYCGTTGAVVLIDDVYSYSGFDLEYLYRHDRSCETRTHSLILVPLRDHDGQTIGILELINAKDAYDRRYVSFKSLEPIIRAFAAQAAVCINNALLIEQNHQLINLLNDTNQRLEAENRRLKERAVRRVDYKIIGSSDAMQKVFDLMDKAVGTAVSVLLTGETGTGKEVFARAIHDNGARKAKLFVTQNCAALPEHLLESELFGYRRGAFSGAVADKKGLFELADGGTLFLDEIGDMPLNLQSKLLRVLQEGEIRPLGGTDIRKVNVRIVAATHCDLAEKIRACQFREDLFFRLAVFPIRLPPLRERGSDLNVLIDHFIQHFSRQYQKRVKGVSPGALELLMRYEYPGNVRELQNVIERAVLLCEDSGAVLEEHLSEQILHAAGQGSGRQGRRYSVRMQESLINAASSSLKNAVNAYEVAVIEQHLQANNWNQTRTAESLQIPRRTLIDKMSRYNIKAPERRKRATLSRLL